MDSLRMPENCHKSTKGEIPVLFLYHGECNNSVDVYWQALHAIKNVLQLRSSEALIFKDFCGLDGALESTRQRLQQLMTEESHREYAMDVESLRREVELIFLGKLNEVTK